MKEIEMNANNICLEVEFWRRRGIIRGGLGNAKVIAGGWCEAMLFFSANAFC